MDLINQIGISYKANYLVQGNQLERCKTSTKLQAYNTELQMRSDGKDFDIASILKDYRGNIIFNIPPINPDLGNLKSLNAKVKKLVENNINMITVNASNLTLDQFEWSIVDEQKKYFLNIVTSIATLASNKIVVAVENINKDYFGNTVQQLADIITYSKKMLIKDFKFSEQDAHKYIGICLNIDTIVKNEGIQNVEKWLNIFSSNIKCIKFSNQSNLYDQILNMTFNECITKKLNCPILFQTEKELEEISKDYKDLDTKLRNILKTNNIDIGQNKIKPIVDGGYTNIIVISMVLVTIVIAILMVLVKIRS